MSNYDPAIVREYRQSRLRLIRALHSVSHDSRLPASVCSVACTMAGHVRRDTTAYATMSLDCPGKIAYSPANVGRYDVSRRRATKLGRWVRSIMIEHDANVHDAKVEAVSQALLMRVSDIGDYITLLSGDDISDAYRKGVGGTSCMTGECNQHLIELYTINDNVELLVYDDGKYKTRAIVWATDDGDRILDRHYPCNSFPSPAIRNWAEANGYYVRSNDDASTRNVVLRKGSDTLESCSVTVTLPESQYMPYMDTLTTCGHPDNNRVSLLYGTPGVFSTQSTEGGPFAEHGVPCSCCGDIVPDDEIRSVGDDSICDSCLSEHYVYCIDACDYVFEEDAVQLASGEWAIEDYFRCDDCAEYYTGDGTKVGNGDCVCDGCLEYYTQCDCCSEHVPTDDIATRDIDVTQELCGECLRDAIRLAARLHYTSPHATPV